eukprot:10648392-Alexandrium_andersonii.AAC.1
MPSSKRAPAGPLLGRHDGTLQGCSIAAQMPLSYPDQMPLKRGYRHGGKGSMYCFRRHEGVVQ